MDSLKLKSLMLSNFGEFEQISVSLNDNVTYLIGGNGSGKSTIGLTGLWFVMQGIASKATKEVKTPLIAERFRFIGGNAANTTGSVVLFDEKSGNEIEITRKMTKSGQTLEIKAPEGVYLTQEWLNDIFDPYMIAPAQFYNLSSKEQALALGIDTEAHDKAIELKKQDLSTEVAIGKRTDEAISNIQLTLEEIAKYTEKKDSVTLSQKLQKAQAAKDRVAFRQSRMIAVSESIERSEAEIERIKAAFVAALKIQREKIKEFQAESNSLLEEDAEYQIMQDQDPESFDVEFISKELSELDKHNDKVKDVETYKSKLQEQQEQQLKIEKARNAVKDAETARVKYLKESNRLPFENMSVNDKGELLLNDKPIRPPYFSTGELLKYVPIILSETRETPLKYVFLQDFSLMDEDKQAEIIAYLSEKGFQIVIEVVEKRPEARPNAIILTGERIVNAES
jgi:DNA repair exonuclease SbcCD ATPase subunit